MPGNAHQRQVVLQHRVSYLSGWEKRTGIGVGVDEEVGGFGGFGVRVDGLMGALRVGGSAAWSMSVFSAGAVSCEFTCVFMALSASDDSGSQSG